MSHFHRDDEPKKTWFYNDLLNSKAYFDLTGKSIQAFNVFYQKRTMKNMNGKKGKDADWQPTNEKDLNFTYIEAKKIGFTSHQFRHAIDQLISVGLIDVETYGGGTDHPKTVFSLSHRWKKYGTEQFVDVPRTQQKRGFCCDDKRYRNPGKDGG
jgi:hypothetical protein